MTGYIISVLVSAGIFALLAQGLNLHWGYTGLLNFGVVAFFAVGAYTMAVLVSVFDWPLWAAMAAAMLAAAVLGVLVALPAIRLRSDYLAITTLAVGEICRIVLHSSPGVVDLTGGPSGIRGYSHDFFGLRETLGLQWMTGLEFLMAAVWIVVLLVLLVVTVMIRSPWGRVLKGIREDEDAMRALGKNVVAYKMQSFAFGAALAGLAGVFFALNLSSITPEAFLPMISIYAWVIILIGGGGSLLGPVVGSVLFWALFNATTFIPSEWMSSQDAAYLRLILVGLLIMVMVLLRPQGLLGNRKELLRESRH
ncbi:branched-chain amino acid ABC transporter permease [Phytoactinopolyspora limicola]|uniref:branched-chain amino acid ABC transporter permease n=1 Tax=Phytoactinopolyspora limicola TaxID=2715536 RepID=UPI00140C2C91|nr:branched-chain amino acid ABC transporter permease [Phytoactinopolyspora limicola]